MGDLARFAIDDLTPDEEDEFFRILEDIEMLWVPLTWGDHRAPPRVHNRCGGYRDREGRGAKGAAVQARSAITVNAPPRAVYAAWRNLEELPGFMRHLESVTVLSRTESHWVVRAPAGTTVEWDAEVVEDVPGERIAWRSVSGANVENSGVVCFVPAPRGQGAEVRVELSYSPPGRALGAFVLKLFGEEPNQQLAEDLRRFKQLVEAGEVARSGASAGGPGAPNDVVLEEPSPLEEVVA